MYALLTKCEVKIDVAGYLPSCFVFRLSFKSDDVEADEQKQDKIAH